MAPAHTKCWCWSIGGREMLPLPAASLDALYVPPFPGGIAAQQCLLVPRAQRDVLPREISPEAVSQPRMG